MILGPIAETAAGSTWHSLHGKDGGHYNTFTCRDSLGMAALREWFPNGEATENRFVMFSTSGVHGSYQTIEDAEMELLNPTEEGDTKVTFLIVEHRIVCLRYGNAVIESPEDVAFLIRLRESSRKAFGAIG